MKKRKPFSPIPAEIAELLGNPRELLEQVAQLWAAPRNLSVADWADKNFNLSPEYAAQAGRWQTLSFQREPLDCISNPAVWQIVIKSCTQLLKSSCIQVGTAYAIDQDPGPILVVQPRDADAKSFSKERIAPMIRDNPSLSAKVSDSKSRSSDNTIEEKWFKGGLLACTSAGSPGNLARRAIRYLFCDEENKWPVSAGPEGNPFSLALKRTATFRHRRKVIRCCSPTVAGAAIDSAYELSDKREFYVPCPHCGHLQSMMGKFRTQVRWNSELPTRVDQAQSARYHCQNCDAPWSDAARWVAVEKGEWRAHEPSSGVAGFWISELYSPWKTLADVVLDYLTKKENVEELKTFVNTSLAENWVDKGEAPEHEALISRQEDGWVPGTVPRGGLFLTAGVDVQREAGGRLEVEVVAWGRNRENWSVDYRILPGRPSEPEVWKKLGDLLNETFPHESGHAMPISRMFVDSGDGTTTNDVYSWVRTQPPDRVVATKGDERSRLPVSQPSSVDVTVDGRKVTNGLQIKTVNVGFFKSEFYAALKLRPPTPEQLNNGFGYPPGYCHFPKGRNYGDEHFRQITSEQLVTRKLKNGRSKLEWQQTRPRNEALDVRILARAGAWDFGMDQAQEQHWAALEKQYLARPVAAPPKPQPIQAPEPAEVQLAPAPPPAQRERWIPARNWF